MNKWNNCACLFPAIFPLLVRQKCGIVVHVLARLSFRGVIYADRLDERGDSPGDFENYGEGCFNHRNGSLLVFFSSFFFYSPSPYDTYRKTK